LSQGELRSALHAIHRVLVVTRQMNRSGVTQTDMERIFDAVENLPKMLMRPAEYEDLFAATLADLAEEFPAIRGINTEFREARFDNALELIDPEEEKREAEIGADYDLRQWPEY
jgi:hypothetical protein